MNHTYHRIRNSKYGLDLLALSAALLLALAFRLPGLTVFLTADEPRSWFGRSIIFLDSLTRGDWVNTAPGGAVPYIENVSLSPAPGITTMWAGAVGIILEYWQQGAPGPLAQFLKEIPFDPLDPDMLFSLRLPGVLIAVAAVGLTYWWGRPLLGRWGALLTAALIALDPFYLALSRVLGHDALVTTFMWLSLLAFLRAVARNETMPNEGKKWLALDRTRFPFLLGSGASAGLAFLSKYPALFIGAFIALAMLIVYLLEARSASVTAAQPDRTGRAAGPGPPSPVVQALAPAHLDSAGRVTAAGQAIIIGKVVGIGGQYENDLNDEHGQGRQPFEGRCPKFVRQVNITQRSQGGDGREGRQDVAILFFAAVSDQQGVEQDVSQQDGEDQL